MISYQQITVWPACVSNTVLATIFWSQSYSITSNFSYYWEYSSEIDPYPPSVFPFDFQQENLKNGIAKIKEVFEHAEELKAKLAIHSFMISEKAEEIQKTLEDINAGM